MHHACIMLYYNTVGVRLSCSAAHFLLGIVAAMSVCRLCGELLFFLWQLRVCSGALTVPTVVDITIRWDDRGRHPYCF